MRERDLSDVLFLRRKKKRLSSQKYRPQNVKRINSSECMKADVVKIRGT